MLEKLIKKRKQKKLNQEEMARMLGIARSTYNAYELGNINIPLDKALKIKEILKYKNDDIFLPKSVSYSDKEE